MFDNGLILFNNKDLIANSWDEIKRFIDGHTAELRESRELKKNVSMCKDILEPIEHFEKRNPEKKNMEKKNFKSFLE
jgi:hypothetical protein